MLCRVIKHRSSACITTPVNGHRHRPIDSDLPGSAPRTDNPGAADARNRQTGTLLQGRTQGKSTVPQLSLANGTETS